MRISREIGQYKKEHHIQVLQTVRYDEILKDRIATAVKMDMSEEFMKTVLEAIHEESIRQQIEIINQK
jgi:chorismate mutase